MRRRRHGRGWPVRGSLTLTGVELLALAASTSLLAGWRLYLVTFVTGLAMRFGYVDLPEHLVALDVLANPWLIVISGAAAAFEFLADKIAWIDSIWDSIHTFIRPFGGALLALAIVDASDPAWQVASFLLGGGAALVSHAGKASARAMVNTSPEPFSNVIVSTGEDIATAGLLALAIANPIAAAIIALALVAISIWLVLAARKFVRRMLRQEKLRPAGTAQPPPPR